MWTLAGVKDFSISAGVNGPEMNNGMTDTGQDWSIQPHRLDLVRSAPSIAFDRVARLAAEALHLPIAAVFIGDSTCSWLVSRVGGVPPMVPNDGSPCHRAIATRAPVAIPDLEADPEYNFGLLAALGVRFFAASPLLTPDGQALGGVCVMGPQAREVTVAEMTFLRDLAALAATEVELRSAGRVDPVSGLLNRAQLLEEIAVLAERGSGRAVDTPHALAMIDLSRPDELSHMLHVVGPSCLDQMIRQDAATLSSRLGRHGRLVHVAQTQFALLAPPGTEPEVLARAVQHDLSGAQLGRDALFSTSYAVGLASILPGEAPPHELLRRAHAALGDARARRCSQGFYAREQDAAYHRAFTILNDFPGALGDGLSLKLVFQPRLELAGERCMSAEALIRWEHPTLGNVPPAEFVRLIEHTSMARRLLHWVLGKALDQLCLWRDSGVLLQVSVNVSPANLEDDDFAAHVLCALTQAGLPPSALELEITESTLLDETGPAVRHLKALSDAGVCIAIDDFGTGYSSLSYLQQLPADVVKIDQSFIRGLSQTGVDERRLRTLVTAMIGLSHELGYRVVAEGIETKDAADMLLHLKCDEVQGYYYARPMPPGAFESWYSQRPCAAPARRAPLRSRRRIRMEGEGCRVSGV